MQNRIFFPQPALDQWIVEGRIDLGPKELVLVPVGRKYTVVEAVRVVAEVTCANDAHGVIGRVKPKRALEELGAEILESSMILGDNAYDVVVGWIATPTVPYAEHLRSEDHTKARAGHSTPSPASEERMLAMFAEGAF